MNIRNFEIPKYWSFYISTFQILTPTPTSNMWPVLRSSKLFSQWSHCDNLPLVTTIPGLPYSWILARVIAEPIRISVLRHIPNIWKKSTILKTSKIFILHINNAKTLSINWLLIIGKQKNIVLFSFQISLLIFQNP